MRNKGLLFTVFCISAAILIALAIQKILFHKHTPKLEKVILVSIDALRADRLGCYGNPREVSPFIDHLARQGTQFLYAFAPQAFTPPSHASMFTSLYPDVFDIPLDPRLPTLASILRKNGFYTTAFTADGFLSEGYGVLNGFEELDDHVIGIKNLESRVKKWLDAHHSENFFLFLHTYYVHVPYAAPEKYFTEFADPTYSGTIINDRESTQSFIERANTGEVHVTPEDIQRLFDIYDSQIRRTDDFVRTLIDELKTQDIYDQTLLILTSDHGEQFYEFGHFQHYSEENPFADVSMHVPLIFHCPILGHKSKPEILAELLDIAPTILDAAGIERPQLFQGKSLFPLISDQPIPPAEGEAFVFFHLPNVWGLRTKDKKLTVDFRPGRNIQLYDLVKDPQERQNIYPDRKKDEHIRTLLSTLIEKQEQNESLRQNLGLIQVQVANESIEDTFAFDERTVLQANFSGTTAKIRSKDSVIQIPMSVQDSLFEDGKKGKGLALHPKNTL
ncbi:MAG: sulfatase, partial [Candidatus Aminicenantes bacterium]